MTIFTIAVYDSIGVPVLVPGDLNIQPQKWSAIAVGGMWDADILVTGGLAQLAGLTAWLGYRVEILNDNGTAVWWGDIASVEITSNGTRRGISLDRMANRIQIRYAQPQPGGISIAADTAWADDTLSQALYGTWEKRLSPEREMSSTEATTTRTTALSVLAQPHYTLVPDGGEPSAHIYCTGYWQRTKRNYYSNLTGLVENNVSGNALPLGLGFSSTKTAFASRNQNTIWEMNGYFRLFPDDIKVKVSGAANGGNNTTFTVIGTDDREAYGYGTTTTVSFDAADDIYDSADRLGFIASDDVFTVTGSASNNDTYIVKSLGADHIQISPSYSGNIVTEGAGSPVVLTRGNHIEVAAAVTNEATGNSVTVTAYGQRYYQPFVLPVDDGNWTVASIEIRLRRVGGPADNVKVQLVADSSGSPSTLIEEIMVAADDIPLEMGWVSFVFANTSTLNYGTTYGLTVLRTGSNSPTNFYEIDIDDAASYAGGAMKVYDGSAWQTSSPACDLVFRVLGATDTGQQSVEAIQSQSWALTVDGISSGITANQYRNGELFTADEVAAWLDMGNSVGLRMLAAVRRNLTAVIYARAFNYEARWVLQDGSRLLDIYGQNADPGYLPAGEWVHLGDRADLGPWAALSPVFIERAEYSVGSGWNLEVEGTEDVWNTGVMQG